MKALHLKSENAEILFDTYYYGGNKGCDWRVSFRTKVNIQVHNNVGSFSNFNASVVVEDCIYSLTEKDLNSLEKWIAGARKDLAKLKKMSDSYDNF